MPASGAAPTPRYSDRRGNDDAAVPSSWAREPGALLSALVVCVLAALVALGFDRSLGTGIALACLPLLPLLLSRPAVAAVLGVATLPFTSDLLQDGPVRVSLADLLLTVALLGTAAVAARSDWRSLQPMVPFVLAYAAVLAVAVAWDVDTSALVNGVQRLQILVVPLVVGAIVLRRERLAVALDVYVVVAAVVGLLFAAEVLPDSLGFQKNPVGQYVVGALLVVVADRGRRWRWVVVPFLAYGLFQTESRGAVLGLVLGILALLVCGVGAHRARTAVLLLPMVAVLGFAYFALPDDVQQRTATLRADDDTSGSAQYTIRIRTAFREDALRLIRDNPLTGVGIGDYLSGNASEGTLTNDPHNVLLLEAAEGGLPLLAGFVLLVVGSSVVVWRMRRDTPLATLALAVQAATVGHGGVDIYWVRGTPVLGWMLVGAALADAYRARRAW